jgi:hypothetical protein
MILSLWKFEIGNYYSTLCFWSWDLGYFVFLVLIFFFLCYFFSPNKSILTLVVDTCCVLRCDVNINA